MSLKFNINTADSPFFSYSISVLLHAAILIIVLILLNITNEKPRINPRFVLVTTQDINPDKNSQPHPNRSFPGERKKDNDNTEAAKITEPLKENPGNSFYSLANTNADTTNLDQVYQEPTLNVTMKYPAGWTYIDEDVNKKLDGVTFWSTIGNYSLPPYINLEVKDKDLFDAGRYKYNIKTWKYTVFYNDPEEMENQVSQVFYIRTNSSEDFSLKLIMSGKDEFKSFQPIFFGMLKSFKFGNGLF
jgi:hypothetical protein